MRLTPATATATTAATTAIGGLLRSRSREAGRRATGGASRVATRFEAGAWADHGLRISSRRRSATTSSFGGIGFCRRIHPPRVWRRSLSPRTMPGGGRSLQDRREHHGAHVAAVDHDREIILHEWLELSVEVEGTGIPIPEKQGIIFWSIFFHNGNSEHFFLSFFLLLIW